MAEFPQDVRQRFDGTPEQAAGGLVREPPNGWRPVEIVDHDPAWAERYATVGAAVRAALGGLVLELEHIGSTSVPGLAAKSIVDVDLVLDDVTDESRYLPALEALGYVLILREPWWQEHRMLVDADEDVHLHVWPREAVEPVRHKLFRDWLRSHPEDRDRYAATKRGLVAEENYTMAKSPVIDDIFARIFAAQDR